MSADTHRELIAALLVAAALGAVSARVAGVDGPLSDSDRSRWATVRALVSEGRFSIGAREPRGAGYEDIGLIADARHKSVDVVLDPASGLFYSSKPPLLPALVALQCRLTGLAAGCAHDDAPDRAFAVRSVLVVWSLLPILIVLVCLVRLVRGDPWLVALAGFGTFLTSFAAGLNNHLPAAAGTALAILVVARVYAVDTREQPPRAGLFLLAGAGAGFAATQELPALSLVVVVVAVLSMRDAMRALGLALPAAIAVWGVALAVNAAAHGGRVFVTFPGDWYRFAGGYWSNPTGIDVPDRSVLSYTFHFLVGHHGVWSLTPPFFLAYVAGARALGLRRAGLVAAGGIALLVVTRALAQGAQLPIGAALVPVALAAGASVCAPWGWWRAATAAVAIGRVSFATTLMVLGFYLAETTNYGGVSMGPRWLIVLVPLWIAAMAPIVDELARSRRGKVLLVVMLGVAVLSATPHEQNPWVHPWLYAWLGE